MIRQKHKPEKVIRKKREIIYPMVDEGIITVFTSPNDRDKCCVAAAHPNDKVRTAYYVVIKDMMDKQDALALMFKLRGVLGVK